MNNWERNGLVSVWVGKVASDAELRAYLAEQYEDDNAPVSKFATDCGLNWYDHDFVDPGSLMRSRSQIYCYRSLIPTHLRKLPLETACARGSSERTRLS